MTAGSIVIDLLMRTGAFETDTKRAEARLKAFKKEAQTIGTAIGTGVALAATALTAITAQAINFADEIDEMSARLLISTETLSGWAYAAQLSGTSLDALTSAIPKLSKNMAEAVDQGSKQAALFKALGIAVTDAEGRLRRVEEVIPEIADRFKALDNPTQEAALAMELFGKSGTELLEFLNRGGDGIQELMDRARELGIVIDGDTAAAAAQFKDQLGDLQALAMALGLQIAERLLPDLIRLTQQLSDLLKEGEAAAEIADTIGAGFKILDGTIRVVTSTVRGITADLIALGNAGQAAWNALTGDWESASRNMDEARVARGMAAKESADIDRVFTGEAYRDKPKSLFSGVTATAEYVSGAEQARLRKVKADLDKLLTGGGKGSGKSQAEKDAEALQRSYESLLEQQRERIALFGTEGEVAQVTYDITHGALKGLTEDQKNLLLENAKWIEFQREAADIEQVWADAAQDQVDAQYRRQKSFDDMMETLREETELLGMNADEQEIWNNLKWAGVTAESDLGKAIIESTRSLQAQRTAMEDQIDIMDGIRDAGRGLFDDVRNGVGVWDALGNAVNRVIDSLTDKALEMVLDQLFGKQGEKGGGSWGAVIGELFGAMFGGAKASGGDAIGWRPILVGEQGPELFMPRTTGRVLNAEQTAGLLGGGGGSVNQYNSFQFQAPTSTRTQTQLANRTGYELRRAARLGG